MTTATGFLNDFHAVNMDSAEHPQLSNIIYMFPKVSSFFLVFIHFNCKVRLMFLLLLFFFSYIILHICITALVTFLLDDSTVHSLCCISDCIICVQTNE